MFRHRRSAWAWSGREGRVPPKATSGGFGLTERYVPALAYGWLTALYDPLVAVTTRERTFKKRLIDQAGIAPAAQVLDLGCGTGTLAVWLKRAVPGARITGLDGDPEVLSRAKRKAERAGLDIRFDRGLSFDLPYADACFDSVLSSLFFHHLTRPDKERTIKEIVRVLKPGGQLHVADWGKPSDPLMRLLIYPVQWLDGFDTTQDNFEGRLPALLSEGGFERVSELGRMRTIFGTLAFYSAHKALS